MAPATDLIPCPGRRVPWGPLILLAGGLLCAGVLRPAMVDPQGLQPVRAVRVPTHRQANASAWPPYLGAHASELPPVDTPSGAAPLVNATWATDGPAIPVLGVSVFVNADLLVRLLNSIDYHAERIVIIQNGQHPGVAQVLRQLRVEHPDWTIQHYPENIGCAGAWNKILEAEPSARYHIISNDDIAFHPGALKAFATAVEQHAMHVIQGSSNKVILYPSHGNLMWSSPPWSCFAILKQAVERVGKFDTNFWPVYHEDYDYMVRMARAGLWQTLIPQAKVQHGWATDRYEPGMEQASKDQGKVAVLEEYKQQQARHERGSPYYALKWGHGETPGIYDAGEGYWNKLCEHRAGQGRVCKPMPPVLYPHPFNDSSLPLSFVVFDSAFRQCLRDGGHGPCRYNHRLLPHPELVPHDRYSTRLRTWSRDSRWALTLPKLPSSMESAPINPWTLAAAMAAGMVIGLCGLCLCAWVCCPQTLQLLMRAPCTEKGLPDRERGARGA
uniref:Glycosyltransferase 2-like domain-containing protein n=1 Tax=Eutreptiella gymnastica TaxID=73025 RepID=A0A7S1HWS1_9EUGL|mmetsp:Transcript_111215/g.192918  ORF Transcript_111215/g.192918 Transcript_111215/m.192918 type:complete len:499 (+) Transcript_111215:151-1647(+)